MRGLVNNWLVDATERRNPYADALLGQLRRWLLSPASALREPALRHLVELCVKKVFTLLLAEARKLGAEIVYADTQTVTIATGKTRLSAAAAFVEGLRASLRRRELFSWLPGSLLCRQVHHPGGVGIPVFLSTHQGHLLSGSGQVGREVSPQKLRELLAVLQEAQQPQHLRGTISRASEAAAPVPAIHKGQHQLL